MTHKLISKKVIRITISYYNLVEKPVLKYAVYAQVRFYIQAILYK